MLSKEDQALMKEFETFLRWRSQKTKGRTETANSSGALVH
jgi:hypothetical protein